jgi:autotransporter family porin
LGSVAGFDDANAVVNNIGGTISDHVFLGQGDDLVNAQSSIGGDVSLDEGSDELIMITAQIVGGAMDGGDDTGAGDGMVDVLRIQGGTRTVPDNTLANWEIIQLTNTMLTLDTATLGVGADPGTDPGTGLNYGITLGSGSALNLLQSLALDGNVTNGASIMLTDDNSADTSLTLTGDYSGNSGEIVLDALLSDDSSPTDRIIVTGGTITGTSALAIRDLGGLGGATTGDGILLVETTGGASSNPDAFELSGPIIIEGFEYALIFGGLNDPDDGNWYLRSAVTRAVPALSPALLGLTCLMLGLIGLVTMRRRRTAGI